MYAFSVSVYVLRERVFAKIYVNRRTKVSNSSQVNYCFLCPFRSRTHFSWQRENKWNTERKEKKITSNNKNNNNKNRPFFVYCRNLLLLLAASLSTTAFDSLVHGLRLLFHSLHLIYISSCALFFVCASSLRVLSNFGVFFPVVFVARQCFRSLSSAYILFSFRSFDINYTFCRNSSLCLLSLLSALHTREHPNWNESNAATESASEREKESEIASRTEEKKSHRDFYFYCVHSLI